MFLSTKKYRTEGERREEREGETQRNLLSFTRPLFFDSSV